MVFSYHPENVPPMLCLPPEQLKWHENRVRPGLHGGALAVVW